MELTICFITNYLTHHQVPFCLEMSKRIGDRFKLIETEKLPEERISLGYKSLGSQYPFVINATLSFEKEQEALAIAENSDVAIIGSAPDKYITKRMRENRLTFRCVERIFKKRKIDVLRMIKHTVKNAPYKKKELYYLLNSAYAAKDFKVCGADYKKMFIWGYFPECKRYEFKELFEHKKKNTILWVGRLIEWKHPDLALKVAERLKSEGYQFCLTMIGNGKMEDFLRRQVNEKDLAGFVNIIGAQPSDKIRSYMEEAEIYIFTSDRQEGWGAVVNEAMNSGCAVVASFSAGSVPCLIENNKNGLIYRNDDFEELYYQVKKLLDSEKLRKTLGKNACTTITDEWNATIATDRLLELIEKISNNKIDCYLTGICSRAQML